MKLAIAAVSAALMAGAAQAQCTPAPNRFCVTFAGSAYALNTITRPTISLTRGQTYTFQMVNLTSAHPFMISTDASGGNFGAGQYINGVTPETSVFGNQTLTFAVPMDAPDILYYQCFVHRGLGGRIDIMDPECPADYNMDGFLDFFDYDEYVTCFESGVCGHNSADFNDDGFVDFFDYDDFVAAFEAGC